MSMIIGESITTIGELRSAIADISDNILVNIGTRKEGYDINQIGYDGISIALETHETDQFTLPTKYPKIYISVEGGAVQACYSNIDIEVILVDLDNLKGADEEEEREILESNSDMLREYDAGLVKDVF